MCWCATCRQWASASTAHARPIAGDARSSRSRPRGPARLAGLKVGDRVAAINGQSLRTVEPLFNLRAGARVDVPVHLTVLRGGQTLDLVVTPALRPTVPPGLSGTFARLHIAQFLFSLLAFYPLPFLAVAVSVLLQRPHDTRAWLLALMLAASSRSPPSAISSSAFHTPGARATLAFWALMNDAAAGRGVCLLRDLPGALRARSACALAQMDDRPACREPGGRIRRGAARRRRIMPGLVG